MAPLIYAILVESLKAESELGSNWKLRITSITLGNLLTSTCPEEKQRNMPDTLIIRRQIFI